MLPLFEHFFPSGVRIKKLFPRGQKWGFVRKKLTTSQLQNYFCFFVTTCFDETLPKFFFMSIELLVTSRDPWEWWQANSLNKILDSGVTTSKKHSNFYSMPIFWYFVFPYILRKMKARDIFYYLAWRGGGSPQTNAFLWAKLKVSVLKKTDSLETFFF